MLYFLEMLWIGFTFLPLFCRNRGYKNEEEAVFCGACGTKLIPEKGEEEPILRTTNQTGQQRNAADVFDAVKAIPKKALIGIALAIVAITAIYFEQKTGVFRELKTEQAKGLRQPFLLFRH